MKKLTFTEADFEFDITTKAHKIAQAKHDAWLKELIDGATKVYCAKPDKENSHLWSHHKTQDYDTHTALLIDVKEIEKKPCEHKNIKASIPLRGFDLSKATHFHQKPEQFYCLDCAVEIEPTGWVAK